MMPLKPISALIKATAFVGFITLLQACMPPKPGTYKNEQIPSGIRDKMHSMGNDLLNNLKTNDNYQLEGVMSRELIAAGHERMRTTEQISNQMKIADYSLLTEYYVVNKFQGNDTIRERSQGINNYSFYFNRDAPEMYIGLYTAPKAPQKWMITAIFSKLDYGWKLTKLELNPYAENGKTSPELMKLAQEQLAKGYLLDASNTASMAVNCMRPFSNMQYVNEDDIAHFNTRMLETLTAKYTLPITVNRVATHPRIIRVRMERTSEGAFPNINYLSTINLNNTDAIKKENDAVGKAIGAVFKGIDKDKKYIYYTIYYEAKKGMFDFRSHTDIQQKLH